MADLEFEDFLKKYSFAINYLEGRLSTKNNKSKLASLLYQDTINEKINMDSITNDIKLFYQGNVLSQVKINNYLENYKWLKGMNKYEL